MPHAAATQERTTLEQLRSAHKLWRLTRRDGLYGWRRGLSKFCDSIHIDGMHTGMHSHATDGMNMSSEDKTRSHRLTGILLGLRLLYWIGEVAQIPVFTCNVQ